MTRRLDHGDWRGRLAYGEVRAATLGYTADDVEGLIAETREDARAAHKGERRQRSP